MWIAQIDITTTIVKAVVDMRAPIPPAPAGVIFVQLADGGAAQAGGTYVDGVFYPPPQVE